MGRLVTVTSVCGTGKGPGTRAGTAAQGTPPSRVSTVQHPPSGAKDKGDSGRFTCALQVVGLWAGQGLADQGWGPARGPVSLNRHEHLSEEALADFVIRKPTVRGSPSLQPPPGTRHACGQSPQTPAQTRARVGDSGRRVPVRHFL